MGVMLCGGCSMYGLQGMVYVEHSTKTISRPNANSFVAHLTPSHVANHRRKGNRLLFLITIIFIIVIRSLSNWTDAISDLCLPDWMIMMQLRHWVLLALLSPTCSPHVLLRRSVLDYSGFFIPNRKATRRTSNFPSHIYMSRRR